jgi:hypothetical protein
LGLLAELLCLYGLHAHADGAAARARADLERARLLLGTIDTRWRPETDLASAGERIQDVDRALLTVGVSAGE